MTAKQLNPAFRLAGVVLGIGALWSGAASADQICETWYSGNTKHWTYCKSGFECAPGNKCRPNAATRARMQKQADAARQKLIKKLEEAQARLKEQAKQWHNLARASGQTSLAYAAMARRSALEDFPASKSECNPSTQAIAGCLSVPRGPSMRTYYPGVAGAIRRTTTYRSTVATTAYRQSQWAAFGAGISQVVAVLQQAPAADAGTTAGAATSGASTGWVAPGGADCDKAGEYERQTAAWYNACVSDRPAAPVASEGVEKQRRGAVPERREARPAGEVMNTAKAAIRAMQAVLAIEPAAVLQRAVQRCGVAQDTDAWKRCARSVEVAAILDADPRLLDLCDEIAETSQRDRCVIAAYMSLVARRAGAADETVNCYWDEHGRPCYPARAAAAAAPKADRISLRERLRHRLKQQRPAGQPDPTEAELDTAEAEAVDTGKTDPSLPDLRQETVPDRSDDDPLAHYLRSTNRHGSMNDGTLLPAPGVAAGDASTFRGLEPTPAHRSQMATLLEKRLPPE